MWRDNELIYDNKFELSTFKLKNSLEVVLMGSPYPHRYGKNIHIEDRGSMVNFKTLWVQKLYFFEEQIRRLL